MNGKIQPQHFKGKYRTIKNICSAILLLIYIFASWIPYERGFGMPNQALMIDLPERKAYIFGIIIWPDELYYLTFTLILAAIGLFICTTLFGRLWCGFTCPHSTMIDIFITVERLIQGDRNARTRLNEMEINNEKFIKKSLTYAIWLVISFLFAFGWVGYFYNSRGLLNDLLNFSVKKNGTLWLVALTASTYLFGGFVREKVCMYMCPYGRFQSGLMDDNTIVVTYHGWRGEPKGKGDGHGDCIDCNRCVIACPMGIDIRNGLQMPCIGCGLCIDACDEVMEKLHRSKGLIAYSSAIQTNLLKENNPISRQIFTPKVLLYSGVFLLVSFIFIGTLIIKSPLLLKVDKIHSPLFTITPDGSIRNTYHLNLINKTITIQENICLSVAGLEGILINIQNLAQEFREQFCFSLKPEEAIESQLFLKLPREKISTNAEYKNIQFIVGDRTTTNGIFYITNK